MKYHQLDYRHGDDDWRHVSVSESNLSNRALLVIVQILKIVTLARSLLRPPTK